jgi:FkbM family methyltransferase
LKPEHLYQPGRLLRRLVHKGDRRSPTALAAFGVELVVMPDELISNSIRRKGIYDVVTAETIYRLLDPGAEAIDAGAHVGLMSAIMALRVGPSGCVHSFEPNPAVYAKLSANAGRINARLGSVVIRTHDLALSDSARQAQLFLPDDWSKNTGVARLDATGNAAATVECRTLDDFGDDSGITSPALMKIDVEGHELAVLRGAPRTLAQLRDVVFEDFGAYPTSAMALLEEAGFQIFALHRTLFRPILVSADRRGMPRDADPNYLATRDPERVRRRFAPAGWRVLRRLP